MHSVLMQYNLFSNSSLYVLLKNQARILFLSPCFKMGLYEIVCEMKLKNSKAL